MRKRLAYRGGNVQQSRMIQRKLESLKKAMVSSYQAATAILDDGREFRCLINPDKLNIDQDDKMISIPFEDRCLNREEDYGMESVGMKTGDVFEWKETKTHWMVYLQYIEELAYFRANIRKCTDEVEVNGRKYWCYIKGPVEKTIDWKEEKHFYINEINYSMVMNIQNTPETNAFFERFALIELHGKRWEVQAVDKISIDGIIEVYLQEYYNKGIEEDPQEVTVVDSRIQGPQEVLPYECYTFTIDLDDGEWFIDNIKYAKILKSSLTEVTIGIITGRSGNLILTYKSNAHGDFILPIKIKSL